MARRSSTTDPAPAPAAPAPTPDPAPAVVQSTSGGTPDPAARFATALAAAIDAADVATGTIPAAPRSDLAAAFRGVPSHQRANVQNVALAPHLATAPAPVLSTVLSVLTAPSDHLVRRGQTAPAAPPVDPAVVLARRVAALDLARTAVLALADDPAAVQSAATALATDGGDGSGPVLATALDLADRSARASRGGRGTSGPRTPRDASALTAPGTVLVGPRQRANGGQRPRATVQPDGSILVDGQSTAHASLTAAARSVNGGTSVAGTTFWQVAPA